MKILGENMQILSGDLQYEYDPAKDALNIAKHKISLRDCQYFDWDECVIDISNNSTSAEIRYVVYGFIGNRLFVMVYCIRGKAIRVISLRKANNREKRKYNEKIKPSDHSSL